MRMSHLTSISKDVRARVYERDSIDGAPNCIFCGSPYMIEVMHYIPRSQGGKGIEENLACGCWRCHQELDNGKDPQAKRERFKEYLMSKYPNWNEDDLKVWKE